MSQPVCKEPPLDEPDLGHEPELCEWCEVEHCIHCHCDDCETEARREYEQSRVDP